jgi:hypothetical protein
VFKAFGIKYFEVNPSLRGISEDTCFSILTKEWLDKIPALNPPSVSSCWEVNPLLQKMQWHTHLAKYTSSSQGIARIRSLAAVAQGREVGYGAIAKVSLEYLQFAGRRADEWGMLLKRIIIQGPKP